MDSNDLIEMGFGCDPGPKVECWVLVGDRKVGPFDDMFEADLGRIPAATNPSFKIAVVPAWGRKSKRAFPTCVAAQVGTRQGLQGCCFHEQHRVRCCGDLPRLACERLRGQGVHLRLVARRAQRSDRSEPTE